MPAILSTRRLSPAQRESFKNSGISLTEYDAIGIKPLEFRLPESGQNAIFTSQNAVRAVYERSSVEKNIATPLYNCFCVGAKTKSLLEKNSQKVIKMSENAKKLGLFIAKHHQNESFFFFSGNLRRDELPTILKKEKIDLFEIKTYETELNSVHFDQIFDKILFFSPSGITSFTNRNTIGNTVAICIGETTASEAKKHFKNVIQSNQNSIENVIELALKN